MIGTVMYCGWLNLSRDRVALGLSFILPLVFFSIFALILGGSNNGDGGARTIDVVVVDLDNSEFSQKFIEALQKQEALRVHLQTATSQQQQAPMRPFTAQEALSVVRKGQFPIALILPEGLINTVGFNAQLDNSKIELIYDPANPLARFTVFGLLQSVGMSAAPNLLMDQGLAMLERYGGPLTEQQKSAVGAARATGDGSDGSGTGNLVAVQQIDAKGVTKSKGEKDNGPNLVAYYAAGIGVMFMLFSMTGAGGGLLEEEENGTLDRLMISRLGMKRLLMGKWLFFSIIGFLQLLLMFSWGWLVFDLPLFTPHHLIGFLTMSLPTACSAAAFGLLLATLAKSRTQLSGMSTIVILIMSAVGGSMMPRFIMPEYMDYAAKFTLNGWAIDGYLKVFWHGDPAHSLLQSLLYLLPEFSVLSLVAVVQLTAAIWFAKRWRPV